MVRLIFILPFFIALTGCGIVYGAAGAVALTGYTVYKGGELVVVSATQAVSSGVEGAEAIVFSDGTLKTECPASVKKVYRASEKVLEDLRFTSVRGDYDVLYGTLRARNHRKEKILLELERVDGSTTGFELRIGKRGDIESSQMIYDHIIAMINVMNSLEEAQVNQRSTS